MIVQLRRSSWCNSREVETEVVVTVKDTPLCIVWLELQFMQFLWCVLRVCKIRTHIVFPLSSIQYTQRAHYELIDTMSVQRH